METELKLRFTSREGYARLLAKLEPMEPSRTRMRAVYYDTADRRLSAIKASFRVRLEGEKYVATIKGKGQVINGVHQKPEWNMTQPDEKPDLSRFLKMRVDSADSPNALREIIETAGDAPLFEQCKSEFTRTGCRIEKGGAELELCIDEGLLFAGGKTDGIWELELEMISGDAAVLEKLGEQLCETYQMEPENRSKYSRCLALLQE